MGNELSATEPVSLAAKVFQNRLRLTHAVPVNCAIETSRVGNAAAVGVT